MRYRTNSQWPVGSVVIPGGTVVDDDELSGWSSVVHGAVPPPDVTPLDQKTRDWLVAVYSAMPDHHHEIAAVQVLKSTENAT
jgi:hypothetical protein